MQRCGLLKGGRLNFAGNYDLKSIAWLRNVFASNICSEERKPFPAKAIELSHWWG
ncbi:MAG: hypothetical protein RMK18_10765 [Armatimonadota bacterium]|nr:hypothetical protein [Armatimonadota bacterium]MCX7776689.1 hypothetical protein [Armatimonadota bacterium]MDW8026327.1 hypothetical protein [Armatimonadota bacterium]